MSANKEVQLKTGSGKTLKTRMFPIGQANTVLSLRNSQWKLDDKGFIWNGIEIAIKSKKEPVKK